MTPELPMTGGCGCGAVRFEVTAPFAGAVYCHCTRCQRRTGAGVGIGARVQPGTVTITAGEEHLRDWRPEGGLGKSFCALCGCGVFGRDADGTIKGVRLGAMDGDPGIAPQAHQFTAYAPSWAPVPDDGLPRYEERAPA